MTNKLKFLLLTSLFLVSTLSAKNITFVNHTLESLYSKTQYLKLCSIEKESKKVVCEGNKNNIYSHNIAHKFFDKYGESYAVLPSYEIAKKFKLHL